MLDELEELQKEYNWYTQKVINLPEGTTYRDLKEAVGEFMLETESLDKDSFYEHVYGSQMLHNNKNEEVFLSIESGWGSEVDISIRLLKDTYALLNVRQTSCYNEESYRCEMFDFVENYLEKKAVHKCPHCGEEISGKGKFCVNCGAPLL